MTTGAAASQPTSRSDALLEAQAHVLEMIVRGLPLADVLAELCKIAEAQSTRPVKAAILLVDDDGKRLFTGAAPSLPAAYSRALDGIAISSDVGTCCAAAARNQMVITGDIATDPSWDGLRHLPLELGLQAAWSLPVVSSTGSVLGTFGTYFLEPRSPLPEESRLVQVLARTAALAIERGRADHTIRASAQRDRFLASLGVATQPLTEPSEVMATTSRMLAEHLGVDRCAYAEVEAETIFVITGDHSRGVPSIVGRWPVAAFGPACARKMLAGEPYVVDDAENHPEVTQEHLPAYRATNIRAVICVPLHKGGKFTAAMAVHQKTVRSWSVDDVELVGVVVARCWEALERARVTRELRESEARHRAIVEASPECVKLVAPDGTLLQMNAAGLRMLEVADEKQVIGHCVYNVVAPEHLDAFRAFNQRVCQGDGGTLAFDIVSLAGTRRSMETNAVALATTAGGFSQLAVTRDVTARVAADRALADSRARLDYAVRLSRVGFWYCDLPFDELVWDAQVKEHFFFAPEQRVTIEMFYDRMHADDRAATRQAIEASIRDHESYDVVYRTVDPVGGAIKWIRALGGTACDADGTPRRFDGVTVDVTAQKQTEQHLSRVLQRQVDQGRLLKKVAEAALTIHAASSLESVLRVTAEEARSIIGCHHAIASLNRGDDWNLAIHSTSFSDKYAHVQQHPVGGIPSLVCRTNRPLRLTQAEVERQSDGPGDGPGAVARGCLAVPFVGHNGGNLGLIQLSDKYDGDFDEADEAILVQLSQIAAVAFENARLYEALRDHDRRKDEFLATLAHELRNPLAPIRTGLQILQMTTSAEQAARTRAVMERQMGHLVRMVDDLLDISRITLGKLTLKKQLVDLRVVLHSALETTRSHVEAGRHELLVEVPEDEIPLEVDPTRMAQVVANLVNNAAKYTPSKGRIVVSAERQGPELVLTVNDNGVGLSGEMMVRVFDMFMQGAPLAQRSEGGLGVGLTLARRLVELHGGSIAAASPGPGLGSTFTIRLPLASPALPSERSAPSSLESAGQAVRVLVVDDNADGAESLSTLLQLKGHDTRVSYNGPDALSVVAAFAPQVVFLDIGLPGLSGYDVARRIRGNSAISQPVLVALTGWGTADDQRKAQEAGFDRHLVKPAEATKVDEVLKTVRLDAPGVRA